MVCCSIASSFTVNIKAAAALPDPECAVLKVLEPQPLLVITKLPN
jgi:hypothetical protein